MIRLASSRPTALSASVAESPLGGRIPFPDGPLSVHRDNAIESRIENGAIQLFEGGSRSAIL